MIPKYRAWVKDKKCMGEVAMLHWSEDLPRSTELVLMRVVVRRPGNGGWISEHYMPYQVELMQCTGLKDKKNDKEIYEGDIVEDEFGNIYEVKIGHYFNGKQSAYGVFACELRDTDLLIYQPDEFVRVVGNKCENLPKES